MTFSTNIPNASESPGVFPAQSNTNFIRLKTIIDADHKFNDTAAADDGFHNRISYINQVSDPAIPAGANALGYSLSVDLGTGTARTEVFSKNTQGFHLMGARAAVLFTGRPTDGACTLLFAYNVTSVLRAGGAGNYGINFSRNMPTDRYCTFGMAQSDDLLGARIVNMRGGANYTVSQAINGVLVTIKNTNAANQDPVTCAIYVFGG